MWALSDVFGGDFYGPGINWVKHLVFPSLLLYVSDSCDARREVGEMLPFLLDPFLVQLLLYTQVNPDK